MIIGFAAILRGTDFIAAYAWHKYAYLQKSRFFISSEMCKSTDRRELLYLLSNSFI